MKTLTIYVQVGRDERASWWTTPRLVRASRRRPEVLDDATRVMVRVDLRIPDELLEDNREVSLSVDVPRPAQGVADITAAAELEP